MVQTDRLEVRESAAQNFESGACDSIMDSAHRYLAQRAREGGKGNQMGERLVAQAKTIAAVELAQISQIAQERDLTFD
jgi:hypothetical protein